MMSAYSWRPRLCHATSVAPMFFPLHSTYLNLPRALHKDYGFLGFVFTFSIQAKLFLLSATLSAVNSPYFPLSPCAFLILYFYSSCRWSFARISPFFPDSVWMDSMLSTASFSGEAHSGFAYICRIHLVKSKCCAFLSLAPCPLITASVLDVAYRNDVREASPFDMKVDSANHESKKNY